MLRSRQVCRPAVWCMEIHFGETVSDLRRTSSREPGRRRLQYRPDWIPQPRDYRRNARTIYSGHLRRLAEAAGFLTSSILRCFLQTDPNKTALRQT